MIPTNAAVNTLRYRNNTKLEGENKLHREGSRALESHIVDKNPQSWGYYNFEL